MKYELYRERYDKEFKEEERCESDEIDKGYSNG